VSTDARVIDPGTLPTRYARGWHCLGLAETFRDGTPHAVEAFGTKLVAFADDAGRIAVLDGYCRHMGGDLTQGTVKDGAIACPFHDWRWGPDGKCAGIPYAKRIPLRARTRAWTTCEENGQLFVWHDAEGNQPIPEQAIPHIEGIGSDAWSDWTWNSLLVENANCREIIDNNVDMAHFFYIHFAYPTFFKNVMEGHVASQVMSSKARPDVQTSDRYDLEQAVLHSEASYYGPSYMIDYLTNDLGGGTTIDSVLINCHYPVTQTSFLLQWGVSVKTLPGVERAQMNKIATAFATNFGEGFQQDVRIWLNKSPIDNPLLTEEDGPVYQHRRWYQQFYTDVADIEPDMIARFEFEVDTTLANEQWHAEVAQNLADRAG
jgi:3-ketosteroid 9alpha-monooxygenase subunit A